MVLTPVEADSLYCLNLADGTLAWPPLAQQDDLYVAGIHHGKIILVGLHGLALSVWPTARQPGTGGASRFPPRMAEWARIPQRQSILCPAEHAEVMAVDLEHGKAAQVSKSREGLVPGNLVCHRGKVISQGWDAVEVFQQTDSLREAIGRHLKANPDDAAALRLRGESCLDEGNLAEAIENLRKAFRLETKLKLDSVRSRNLLCEALLEGLRRDFATYAAQAAEIKPLLDEPNQRIVNPQILYARLMAEGLRKTGQWRPAFEQYVRLMELNGSDRALEVAGPWWLRGAIAGSGAV